MLALLCAIGSVPLPLTLLLGLIVGLVAGNPVPDQTNAVQRYALQGAVVGLGFSTPWSAVLEAGTTGMLVMAAGVSTSLILGWGLARSLRTDAVTGQLVAVGTAVCGGSAIAALGPVLGARPPQMAAALGCVLALNAIALYAFPPLAQWAGLSPEQFGYWAAMAIHDTSSVVGAASQFPAPALALAVSLKLVRTLWILPLVVAAHLVRREAAAPRWPWFILWFVLASVCATAWPAGASVYSLIGRVAHAAMAVALFLCGTSLTMEVLRNVGWRPLLQGVILWLAVSAGSLGVLLQFWSPA